MSRTNLNHRAINRIVANLSRSLFHEATAALRRSFVKFATAAAIFSALIVSFPSAGFAAKLASIEPSAEASAADRAACTPDAFRLCSSAIPSVDRVIACLKAEKAKLSSPCRTVMQKHGAI